MISSRADRAIDVRFHEFMADDFAMVERIYAVAGQPMTAGGRGPGWSPSWPTTRVAEYGTVVYDLADFGIDASERRRALQPYADRFGVRDESAPP